MQRRELLIGGAASLLLASCGQTPTAGPLTIRLESYNYGSPGLGGKALQTMIDEFQALNPGIKVEGKNTAPTPDGQMKMIVTEQAAGDPRTSLSSVSTPLTTPFASSARSPSTSSPSKTNTTS